mmetsp:Transcript_20708/g.23630  ORF Transcript_20708/g.23630 Transcript_20708/m.23630 type:complete len:709 (-) Transcript_20708:13-2139(-)
MSTQQASSLSRQNRKGTRSFSPSFIESNNSNSSNSSRNSSNLRRRISSNTDSSNSHVVRVTVLGLAGISVDRMRCRDKQNKPFYPAEPSKMKAVVAFSSEDWTRMKGITTLSKSLVSPLPSTSSKKQLHQQKRTRNLAVWTSSSRSMGSVVNFETELNPSSSGNSPEKEEEPSTETRTSTTKSFGLSIALVEDDEHDQRVAHLFGVTALPIRGDECKGGKVVTLDLPVSSLTPTKEASVDKEEIKEKERGEKYPPSLIEILSKGNMKDEGLGKEQQMCSIEKLFQKGSKMNLPLYQQQKEFETSYTVATNGDTILRVCMEIYEKDSDLEKIFVARRLCGDFNKTNCLLPSSDKKMSYSYSGNLHLEKPSLASRSRNANKKNIIKAEKLGVIDNYNNVYEEPKTNKQKQEDASIGTNTTITTTVTGDNSFIESSFSESNSSEFNSSENNSCCSQNDLNDIISYDTTGIEVYNISIGIAEETAERASDHSCITTYSETDFENNSAAISNAAEQHSRNNSTITDTEEEEGEEDAGTYFLKEKLKAPPSTAIATINDNKIISSWSPVIECDGYSNNNDNRNNSIISGIKDKKKKKKKKKKRKKNKKKDINNHERATLSPSFASRDSFESFLSNMKEEIETITSNVLKKSKPIPVFSNTSATKITNLTTEGKIKDDSDEDIENIVKETSYGEENSIIKGGGGGGGGAIALIGA